MTQRAVSEADQTPRGHDLSLLRELLELSPEERVRRNAEMVRLIERLRQARAEGSAARSDTSSTR